VSRKKIRAFVGILFISCVELIHAGDSSKRFNQIAPNSPIVVPRSSASNPSFSSPSTSQFDPFLTSLLQNSLTVQGSQTSTNKDCLRAIDSTLSSNKKGKRKRVSFGDAEAVKQQLDELKDTPGNSKKEIARGVVDFCANSLDTSPSTDPRNPIVDRSATENNQRLRTYRNSEGNANKMIRINLMSHAIITASPLKEEHSVYDVDHSQNVNIEFDASGSVKRVLGGHDLNSYRPGQLQPDCFVGADSQTIGVSVGGHLKTVARGFTADWIMNNIVKKSRSKMIATQDKNCFEVRQNFEGKFYGAFRHGKIPVVVNTIFPLLVVSQLNHSTSSSSSDTVKVGSFGRLSDDFTVIPGEDFSVPQAVFDDIVRRGTPIKMNKKNSGNLVLTDISAPVLAHVKNNDPSAKSFHPIFALTPKK